MSTQQQDPLLQLQGTKFLKSTGIFDAYEHVINTMILNGWPSDKSIFEHASYELLRWASEHKDEYRGLVGRSMEKRSDLIYASRDHIPELSEFKKGNDFEKHQIEMNKHIKDIVGVQKIQLKSKKMYNLSQNKLDLSIFEFKDRPLFRKKESSNPSLQASGRVEIRNTTKPTKKTLIKVEDTSFTVGQYDQRDGDQDQIIADSQRSIQYQQKDESFQRDEEEEVVVNNEREEDKMSEINIAQNDVREEEQNYEDDAQQSQE